jgi:nitrogen fixation/metabolism regulation signal transduction histidine kinase
LNTPNESRFAGRLRTPFNRLSLRIRIILSLLFTFVLILPAVSLTLYYFSDLLTSMNVITRQDVELGQTATNLGFTIFQVHQQERGYRIFGSAVERDRIQELLAHADTLLDQARKIAPPPAQGMVTSLSRNLNDYRINFGVLTDYLDEHPFTVRLQLLRSRLPVEAEETARALIGLHVELERAAPARRDSILATALLYADEMALDRIVASAGSGNTRISYLQRNLETARRNGIVISRQMAEAAWTRMRDHQETGLRIEARAKRNVIFLFILTAILFFFAIFRLPRMIIRPITGLSGVFRKAGNGEWGVHAPILSNDEVGELAASYNQVLERMRLYDDLKTKRIATQRRFVERLIDYMHVPVCILTRNMNALYFNSQFAGLFDASLPSKIPDGGLDITHIPEMSGFIEELRKHIAQAGGDFQFTITGRNGEAVILKGRPVRNATLNLESVVVVGVSSRNGKEG